MLRRQSIIWKGKLVCTLILAFGLELPFRGFPTQSIVIYKNKFLNNSNNKN